MTTETIQIYKKWRRGGFVSVYNWPHGDRVMIEIADVDVNTNERVSMATCYVNTLEFLAYLHAEVNDRVLEIVPSLTSSGKDHGWISYGGKKIARVFKVEDWAFNAAESAKNPSTYSFTPTKLRRFKCGEFEIKQGSQASEPDYSKMINLNSIQMKQVDLSIIYHALLLSQQAYEGLVLASGLTKEEFRKRAEEARK